MKLTDILKESSVISDLKSEDKSSVIYELAKALKKTEPSIPEEKLAKALLDREKLGSTGIGSGVAIPHSKLPSLKSILAGFGRSKKGIEFDSQDGEVVHLFFVLVAPETSAGLHLKVLAKLSRLLKSAQFREKLLQAQDATSIYNAIQEEEEKS